MTRDHQPFRSLPARVRRALVVACVGAVGVVGLSATSVDAGARTSSTVIADSAAQAVDALERWEQTLNPVDYVRFVQHRDQAAAMTEADVELPDGALRDAWANVSIAKQHAVLNAVSQLGVPYRNLASKPGIGFDCSGLTVWAFAGAGIEIPRVSRDQINDSKTVERSDAEAGDLVYYPGHISIYLGAETMVHAPNSGNLVEVAPLPDKSLRFGDAEAARLADAAEYASLVDRALAVTE